MDKLTSKISSLEIKRENKGEDDIIRKKLDTEYCVSIFGDKAQEGIEIINPINGRPYEHISEIPRKNKRGI
jgi:hypothetical protein